MTRTASAIALAVPLLLYVPLLGLYPGDGSSSALLIAMYHLGEAPSPGYPMMTLAGALPSRLLLGTTHFNTSLLLGALPSALTSWILFRAARYLRASNFGALASALLATTAPALLATTTALSPAPLTTALLVTTLYAAIRFFDDPGQLRWLFTTALAFGMCCAHEPIMALGLPSLISVILLGSWRPMLNLRVVLGYATCVLAPWLFYAYIPITAWAAPDNIPLAQSWVDARGLLEHIFADYFAHTTVENVQDGARTLTRALLVDGNPAGIVFGLIGVIAIARAQWRWLIALALIVAPTMLYLTALPGDSTHLLVPLMTALALPVGVGISRVKESGLWYKLGAGFRLRRVVELALLVALIYNARRAIESFDANTITAAMSQTIRERSPQQTIILTHDTDAHTLPLWYWAYVEAPRKDGFAVVDHDTYTSSKSYRAFLKTRHPNIAWPAPDKNWEMNLASRNKRYTVELLATRSTELPGLSSRPNGWTRTLVTRGTSTAPTLLHHFTARTRRRDENTRFHHGPNINARQPAACVIELAPNHPPHRVSFALRGPAGHAHEFPERTIPAGNTTAHERIPSPREPGTWTCEVTIDGAKATTTFEVSQ